MALVSPPPLKMKHRTTKTHQKKHLHLLLQFNRYFTIAIDGIKTQAYLLLLTSILIKFNMTDQPTFASPLTANHFQKPKKKKAQNHESEAKRMKLLQEEEEEERLTNLLFGGGIGVDDTEAAWHDDDDDEEESVQSDESDSHDENQDLFQIDRTGVDHSESEDEQDSENEESEEEEEHEEEKATTASAWHDDDDEELQVSLQASDRTKKLRSNLGQDTVSGSTYEQKLRERYEATTGATSRTDWAALPESDDDDRSDVDSDHEFQSNFLSSTAPLLSNNRLQPNILNVVRCPDANLGHYNQSTVNAVQFHPGSDEDEPLMLTAGLDKTLRFFKINGKNRKKHWCSLRSDGICYY